MGYECDFCGKPYNGPGSAGHVSQHIQREHRDKLQEYPDKTYSLSQTTNTKNKLYKVFATKI